MPPPLVSLLVYKCLQRNPFQPFLKPCPNPKRQSGHLVIPNSSQSQDENEDPILQILAANMFSLAHTIKIMDHGGPILTTSERDDTLLDHEPF